MSPGLSEATVALYYLVLGVLAVFGSHRLVLLALYYRHRGRQPASPPEPERWPTVTVQLPVYNELYVAERLVEAVAAFDYPRDRLEIQVLDDSTDETAERLAALVERLRRRGVPVRHLHREDRTGYKAGALAAGLEEARGELIAVFDADFVPPPEFLRRTVPHFTAPEVGMVQARWEHINRDWSRLTRVQAVFLDGHFLIEHAARCWSGRFFNFNGTAGVWRRRAIEEAGGWQHDTLTEDLDLSYRAQLAGWKFRYLPEVVAPAELPVEVHAFKRQQFRWAKGSIQSARKLLGTVLRAGLPWRVKLESLVHLTNNVAYVLMVLLSLLTFPAMLLRRDEGWQLLAVDLPLFAAATVSVLLYYVASQRVRGRSWLAAVAPLPALLGVGIGLSVNNCRAVVEGLLENGGTFERTPKYRIEGRGDDWRRKRYRAGRNTSLVAEGLLALYFVLCTALAVYHRMWWALPFVLLFLWGYATIFALSALSLAGGRRSAREEPSPAGTGGSPAGGAAEPAG